MEVLTDANVIYMYMCVYGVERRKRENYICAG